MHIIQQHDNSKQSLCIEITQVKQVAASACERITVISCVVLKIIIVIH